MFERIKDDVVESNSVSFRIPSQAVATDGTAYLMGRPLVAFAFAAPAAVSLLVCISSPMYLDWRSVVLHARA